MGPSVLLLPPRGKVLEQPHPQTCKPGWPHRTHKWGLAPQNPPLQLSAERSRPRWDPGLRGRALGIPSPMAAHPVGQVGSGGQAGRLGRVAQQALLGSILLETGVAATLGGLGWVLDSAK